MPQLRNLLIIAVFCVCASSSQSQTTTALLMVESGGSIRFSINSLTKYKNGMALEDWTRLAISFSDTADSTITWKLQFKANTDVIIGDYGRELPLEYLVLEARDGGGNNILGTADNGVIQAPETLSTVEKTLILEAPQGGFQDNKLYISYRLGQGAEDLMGQPSDYYFVDIEFILSPNN